MIYILLGKLYFLMSLISLDLLYFLFLIALFIIFEKFIFLHDIYTFLELLISIYVSVFCVLDHVKCSKITLLKKYFFI